MGFIKFLRWFLWSRNRRIIAKNEYAKDDADIFCYCGGCNRYLTFAEELDGSGHDCPAQANLGKPYSYRCGSFDISLDKQYCLKCNGKKIINLGL